MKEIWIYCSCGSLHRLLPGLDAPVYWCGDELRVLRVGDGVKVEA